MTLSLACYPVLSVDDDECNAMITLQDTSILYKQNGVPRPNQESNVIQCTPPRHRSSIGRPQATAPHDAAACIRHGVGPPSVGTFARRITGVSDIV